MSRKGVGERGVIGGACIPQHLHLHSEHRVHSDAYSTRRPAPSLHKHEVPVRHGRAMGSGVLESCSSSCICTPSTEYGVHGNAYGLLDRQQRMLPRWSGSVAKGQKSPYLTFRRGGGG